MASLFLNLCLRESSTAERLQGFTFLMIYLIAVVGRWDFDRVNGTAQVVNMFMDFEEKSVKGKLKEF